MVIAEVHEILFYPIPPTTLVDLTDPRPPDSEHFGYSMRAMISHRDSIGADAFSATVCSPSWLAARLQSDDEVGSAYFDLTSLSPSIIAPALWIIRQWDRAEIERGVRSICDEASPGPDWVTVADRIGRSLPWEYAYRYDEDVNRSHGILRPPRGDV
jgi:hypothetical protein